MKQIYIVKRADLIHQVSTNLKAAYNCLISHQSEMEVTYLRSYMQLTRIFKQKDYFYVPSNSGPRWEILRFPVVSYFVQ